MSYNTEEERLKVKGSEQITRDLKVNRDVFVGGGLSATTVTVEDVTLTGDINAGGSTGTEGQVLTIKEGHPTWGDSSGTSSYTNLATDSITVKTKMVAGGNGQFSYASTYEGKEVAGAISPDLQVLDAQNHVYIDASAEGEQQLLCHVTLTNETCVLEGLYLGVHASEVEQLVSQPNMYQINLSPIVDVQNPSQPKLGSTGQLTYCYPDDINKVTFWNAYNTSNTSIALPSKELLEAVLISRTGGTLVVPNDAWWVYNPSTNVWTPYTFADFENLSGLIGTLCLNTITTFGSFEVDKDLVYLDSQPYVSSTSKEYNIEEKVTSSLKYLITSGFTKESSSTVADIKALVSSELVYFEVFDNVSDLPDLNTLNLSEVDNTYAFVGDSLYTYISANSNWQEASDIYGAEGISYRILNPYASFTVPAITNVPDFDYLSSLSGKLKLDSITVIDSNDSTGENGESLIKTENGIEWKKTVPDLPSDNGNYVLNTRYSTSSWKNIDEVFVSEYKERDFQAYSDAACTQWKATLTVKYIQSGKMISILGCSVHVWGDGADQGVFYLKDPDVKDTLFLDKFTLHFTLNNTYNASLERTYEQVNNENQQCYVLHITDESISHGDYKTEQNVLIATYVGI